MTSLGFTGSRSGPTIGQIAAVETLLVSYQPTSVHHGDCVGADEWFHETVIASCRKHKSLIHIHPPIDPKYRAWCEKLGSRDRMVIHEPLPYLKRNQRIVDFSHVLVACPSTNKEVVRSGTWATVRRARDKGIRIHIVYLNGNIKLE